MGVVLFCRLYKCEYNTFPATGICAARIAPLYDSVMNSVLRSGPPY
ncbi:MAG: hypothetical protein JWM26_3887, partial [Betaproteobacteria bacterium]|nr:hypothetical protein [Betaproteobacteria bacterium]